MDKERKFLLEKLSVLSNIAILIYENQAGTWKYGDWTGNPLADETGLCRMLMERAESQRILVVYQDEHMVVFAAVKSKDCYCLFGTM